MEATKSQLKIDDPVVKDPVKTQEKKHDQICVVCKTAFKSSRAKHSTCSNSCRSKLARQNRKTSLNMTPEEEEKPRFAEMPPKAKVNGKMNGNNCHIGHSAAVVGTPIFHGLSPQMQIAVDLLKQDSRRWEQLYKDEKEKRKKVTDRYETLREEMASIKVDHRISEIENKRPSGLEGFAENPMVLKLLDHVGPALGALMLKLGDGGAPSSQLIGTDGQLDEITQTQSNEMIKWFISLPTDTRTMVYEILTELAASKSIEVLNETLMRMRNILRSGTVIMPHVGFGTIQ